MSHLPRLILRSPSLRPRNPRGLSSGLAVGIHLLRHSSDGAAAAGLLLDLLLATGPADARLASLLRLVAAEAPAPRADAKPLQRSGLRSRGCGPGIGHGRRSRRGRCRVPDGGGTREVGREGEAQADANIAGEQG